MPRWGQIGPNVHRTILALWRTLGRRLIDPYRPELHYMRGPGPKWREKHGQAALNVDHISATAKATAETDSLAFPA